MTLNEFRKLIVSIDSIDGQIKTLETWITCKQVLSVGFIDGGCDSNFISTSLDKEIRQMLKTKHSELCVQLSNIEAKLAEVSFAI